MTEENEIELLKNNDERNISDLKRVVEFYDFLRGEVPDTMSFSRGHAPKMSAKKAFGIIYYLQENFPVIPDHIEQCSVCRSLFDSYCGGYHSDKKGKFYCSGCCDGV